MKEAVRQDHELGLFNDPVKDGLKVVLGYPPHDRGYKTTRNTQLDPQIRVSDIFKYGFPAPPTEPFKSPANAV